MLHYFDVLFQTLDRQHVDGCASLRHYLLPYGLLYLIEARSKLREVDVFEVKRVVFVSQSFFLEYFDYEVDQLAWLVLILLNLLLHKSAEVLPLV